MWLFQGQIRDMSNSNKIPETYKHANCSATTVWCVGVFCCCLFAFKNSFP